MKTVKQILEQVNYKNDDNDIITGLSQLAESGLFDEAKLPMMKRALTKTKVNEMTEAEKKTLYYFVENVVSQILDEQQDYLSKLDPKSKMAYPSDKDMPAVIILKRKAIRVYPDNQKVALYYSQALDKYVSIPFGSSSKNLGTHLTMNEETEKRTSIADLTTKRLEKISKDPGKLTRIWRSTSDDPEKRQKLASNLGAKQRNMVQGGNIEAIKYAAKHSNLPTTAGVALGVGLRAAFEKMRGTKEVKPEELKGSVPSIQAKQGLQSDKVGNETPWGPRPEVKMKNTIKESFKHRLQEKREKNIEEEGAWDATKAAAAGAARELSFGLSDKAIDALGGKEERERLAKEHPTATKVGEYGSYAIPFGAGLSLAKGAYAGGKAALKGAELLGKTGMGAKAVAAARGAAAGAGKTLPGRAIKGIGRGVKGAAKGAAALGALAVSGGGGGSDSGSASAPGGDFRSTGGQYEFGKSLTGVTIGKSNQTPYGGDPLANIAQRKAFGVNEQTNFNKIRILSENKDAEAELVFEDSSVTVNGRIAKKIMNIHESLNKRNKKKVEKMINEDITSLTKVINFSVRQ